MDISLVEIKQDRPGFDRFIGSWVCRDDKTLLIDVGPARTAGRLLASLDEMGVERVDYVLITHIHLDHAGALAPVLERYPMARAVCHQKAVKFLVDPSTLWEGSLKVLGEVAQAYGRPGPVLPEKIIPHPHMALDGLVVVDTPGHAAHHLSFSYKKRLFAGEAAGNFTMVGEESYLRPATPPRFFFHVSTQSLDRLLALEDQPIYFAHFGRGGASHPLLERYRRQLVRWREIIGREMPLAGDDAVMHCFQVLLEEDPDLGAFRRMDASMQQREMFFLRNSIQGFMGFLSDQPQAP